jgi:hypothetical protein
MVYYKAGTNLIKFDTISETYVIKNTIDTFCKSIISKDEFLLLNPVKIKKSLFYKLLNNYFKDIKHWWKYEHQYFRKLENFDKNGNSSRFKIHEVPSHSINNYNDLKIVYHCGKIYYMHCNQYFPKIKLFDFNTLRCIKWTNIKNVTPIFNENIKKII